MQTDTYKIERKGAEATGCIDIVESFDDNGYYAQEYDFARKDGATRTSSKIYPSRDALVRALDSGKHRWTKWD